jgi:hypothetical protein
LRKAEINKLINIEEFFQFITDAVTEGTCTYIEAAADYARKHDIEIDIVANIIKTHKGPIKAMIDQQCKDLRIIND